MRYGLIPQSPQEEAALRHAPHARTLFDPFLPAIMARAIVAFVRLGLVKALAVGACGAAGLAVEFGLYESGLRHLLRILASAGYVAVVQGDSNVEGERGKQSEATELYELTELSRETLLEGGRFRLDAWVLHNLVHWRAVTHLEDALSKDGVRDLHHHLDSPEEWDAYQRAMLQTARPAAEAVAQLLPAPANRELLLDLGGSHGLYGAAICRRFPAMRCRVVDLSEAVVHARRLGRAEGIADVVEYVEGDVLEADFGEMACDVIFLGNIVHHFDEDRFARLLPRVRRALRPGGVVAIWDMVPPPDGTEPDLVAEGFSLLFHLTSASTCRSPEAQVNALLRAGFNNAEVHRGPSPTHCLITAKRM